MKKVIKKLRKEKAWSKNQAIEFKKVMDVVDRYSDAYNNCKAGHAYYVAYVDAMQLAINIVNGKAEKNSSKNLEM